MNVPIPEKMEFIEENGQLIIRKKWFGVHDILNPICIFWCGFLVVWYGIAFSDDTPLMMKLFPLGHVALALVFCYVIADTSIKRIIMIIEPQVKHYLLSGCNKCVDVQMKQLYTSERVTNNKNELIRYRVNVIDNQGRSKGLVGGLESKEQGCL